VHDDDIDMDKDKDDSSPQEGDVGGRKGGTRCSGFAPPEEMLETSMTKGHDAAGSSGFNKPISTNIWMITSLVST